MTRTIVLLVLALAAPSWAAPANASGAFPLGEAEMRQAFFGRTLQGEYSDGLTWSERFGPNGTTVYREVSRSSPGRVRFGSNKRGVTICFSYENPLAGGCFEVWRRSNNCFDFYDADGAASVRQRRNGTGWTARAWDATSPSTCTANAMS